VEIEDILEQLRQKRFEHAFSEQDAAQLRELGVANPCHLHTQLLLIEYAGVFFVFPEKWTVYYQTAIDSCAEKWSSSDLADIYLMAMQLFFYDQDQISERDAANKAFELAPDNPQAIISYLGQFSDDLPPDHLIELIERISITNPERSFFYYVQGRYFEEYASQYSKPQYRDAAIAAYQKMIEMNNNKPYHEVPNHVAEAAIKRIMSEAEE
jgi:tetratricopeptide (TPR) repeat protein